MSYECQAPSFAHTKKDAAISVRLSQAVKKAAENAAAADRRSVASMIEKMLTEKLIETGYLKNEQHG